MLGQMFYLFINSNQLIKVNHRIKKPIKTVARLFLQHEILKRRKLLYKVKDVIYILMYIYGSHH